MTFSLADHRPEVGAGGFTRDSSTLEFFERINALARPDFEILDLGAGRGWAEPGEDLEARSQIDYVFRQICFKGRVKKVTGADIDPVVTENETLDEAVIIKPGEPYPFPDASFDLIFADWVIEHVEDVDVFVSEISRVLKPGGWFCARTPNKHGYLAMAARALGERLEDKALSVVQPGRESRDVFPKFYRLNTLSAIGTAFKGYLDCSYRMNSEPGYHGNRRWLFRLLDFYQNATPGFMDTVLLVYVQKKD